jgi:DNA-binding transcriptional MerR regulator
VTEDLAIKDVAERTGIAAGTIRMWEQRYGFPEPQRLPSGYRRYTPEDVETLRRIQAYRRRGLSVSAAIERAREAAGASDRRSCASRRSRRSAARSSTRRSRSRLPRC